jgi:hypothetical protein
MAPETKLSVPVCSAPYLSRVSLLEQADDFCLGLRFAIEEEHRRREEALSLSVSEAHVIASEALAEFEDL